MCNCKLLFLTNSIAFSSTLRIYHGGGFNLFPAEPGPPDVSPCLFGRANGCRPEIPSLFSCDAARPFLDGMDGLGVRPLCKLAYAWDEILQ